MEQDCKCNQIREIERLSSADSEHRENLDNKVNWVVFWSISSLFFACASAVWANSSTIFDKHVESDNMKFDKLTSQQGDINVSQAKIDVQYSDINKQLIEIKIQLSQLKK